MKSIDELAGLEAKAVDTESVFPEDDALREAVDAVNERLEYELRGAWRAGYDYLHVYGPTMGAFDPDEPVTIKQAVFPAYSEQPPRRCLDEWVYQYTYDLTSVPDDVLRRAIRGEIDTEELREVQR